MTSDATPVEPHAPAIAVDPDARRTVALVVGISATVAFAIVRIVVALDPNKPLGIDAWWHDLMVSTETDTGLVLAWIPAHVGNTVPHVRDHPCHGRRTLPAQTAMGCGESRHRHRDRRGHRSPDVVHRRPRASG